MTIQLGMQRPGSKFFVPFNTFDSNDPSASVAIAAFILTDIHIFKEGGTTPRASDSGVVLLDSDGIDFAGHVGIGGFEVDLADNSTAGFYVAGAKYFIVVGPTTVDAGVVNFVAATFEIGMPGAVWNTGITSLTSATQFILDEGPAEASVLIGSPVYIHDVASKVQFAYGVVKTYAVTTREIVLEATPVGFTPAATDNVSFFMPTDLHSIKGTVQTAGDLAAIVNAITAAGPTKTEMDTAHGLLSTIDMLRGLVQVNGTIGATGNTTTKLHLDGLTYGNDEINGWTLVVFDDSTAEYHQCLITDWVLSSELATVQVQNGAVLPFTPEASTDKYWLVTPSTTTNIWDRILNGATHNVASSAGRRLRGIQEFQGYEGGAIWIDTVNGAAGTTDFENGTVENPVNSITDANTLAASLNINIFEIAPGSTITLPGAQIGQIFRGHGWTLALGGRDVSNAHFFNAFVSGTATSPTGEMEFHDCEFVNATLGEFHMYNCGLGGTITATAAATYKMVDCHSAIAGASTPVFNFGTSVGNTALNMRGYSGGIQIEAMGNTGTDTMSLEGDGQFIEGTCVGGTVVIRGHFPLSGITNLTIDSTARYDNVLELAVKAETDKLTLGDAGAGQAGSIIEEIENRTAGGPTKAQMDTAHALLATPAQVNAQVVDVLVTDTFAEPAQGQPGNTLSIEEKISYIYAALINNIDVDSGLKEFRNAAGTVIWKKVVADDGSNYSEAKGVTGP